ncbi:glycosyltransferase family 9 protein [candidate division KSB1 bacterium]
MENMNNSDKLKILVLRLSSMGDIVLTFPFVRLLRKKFPDAQIDYVVKKRYDELIKSNKNISKVYSFDSQKGFNELKRLKRLIKSEKYTYIFDIHRSLRSYYLRKFSGAKKVFLYKKYRIKRWLLINLNINLYNTVTPVYKAYINSARRLGLTDDNEGFDFNLDDKYLNKIDDILKEKDINSKDFLVALCPGSGHESKSWTVEGFSGVGKFFVSKCGAEILFIGGENDFDKGEMIKKIIGDGIHNFCGRLSIMESAALISKCSLIIANDAGPMHLAEALSKNLVAIFGPTVEEFGFFPINTNAVVVQKLIFCRPCSNNGWKKCHKKETECLNEISSDDVINACLNLINNSNMNKSNKEYISLCNGSGFSYINI